MSDHREIPRERRDHHADRPSGWHAVNVGQLVMGAAFVGLFVVWLLVERDVVDLTDTGWVLAFPWLAAGALGLVATVLRHRARPYGPTPEAMHGWSGHSGRMHGWIGHQDSPDSRD